ncbi:hypothetical protein [Streptomyces sp. NPDC046821]|uniref:zinc finger domain-containing protein n=1 Tax=Streptomyces sp. NPDC046821 TaxID=3154702 RepID=UPI0033C78569
MNNQESTMLCRYVRALCPQQKFDEYTPDAWHDLIGDYRLDDCRAAAAAVARRQPFVSPAEIIDEIRAQRATAATDFQGPGLCAEVPDADPDDVKAYLAAIRGQRTRAGDGQSLHRRPVAELVESLGDQLLADYADTVTQVRRPGPLGVECPTCKAAIGRPCKAPARDGRSPRERGPHSARRTAAKGETTVQADDVEARRAGYLHQLEQMTEPTA